MNSITRDRLVSLLVVFLCLINSCPPIFASLLDDTLSNNTHSYLNLDEKQKYESSSSLSSTLIKTWDSGGQNVDLNSVITEKGDLLEKKFVVNQLLERNLSSVYDGDQGYYNNSWWWDVIKDIIEFLPSLSDCSGWKYRCFENETKYQGFGRVCDCDSSCKAYGECCIDEAAMTSEREEISMKNRMFCGLLSRKVEKNGIYMIGDCLPDMKGSFEEKLCLREVEEEGYGVILDIPVLSLDTNITYINYYCAYCNHDSNEFLHLDFSISCSPKYLSEDDANLTVSEFLLEAKYNPRQLIYERTLLPNNNEVVFGNGDSVVLDSNATLRTSHLRTSPSSLSQICNVEISQYQDVGYYANLYNSRTCIASNEICSVKPNDKRESCTKQVTDCDSTWPIKSDFDKCQLYSMKVYDKSQNILYKNPHCAKCNFASLSEEQFSCNDLTAFNPLRSGFKPRIGEPFFILFQIPNQSLKKCPKRDEIWSPFDGRCSKIICGIGRVLKKGECVNSENEANESNVTQHSLLNSCPTIAVSNFTLYENESVYYYGGDIFYEKGDYELYNDSVILICTEEVIYFKKNFLISYYLTVAVLSISLVCLVFHISLYFCFARLRTWHGRNLLSLCFSLFIAQLLFLTGTTATYNFGFCVFMAVCIHYFWLASFFWMNILSIDVLRTFKTKFTQNSNNNKVFLVYNLYSWGVPFIIVMLSLTLDLASNDSKFKPNYAGFDEAELCWINNKVGLLCFFLLPVAIIITENLIFFTITSYKIYSQSKETRFARIKSQSVKIGSEQNLSEGDDKIKNQEKANQNNKIRFILYLKLGILQGLTWVFGFLASYVDSKFCWSIFTIFNGLQGAAIVLCFDLKKWIFLSIWRKLDIDSLKFKFLKRTKRMPFENDLPREESEIKDFKEAEKKSSCKKENTKRSSFLCQPSLIFRSHKGSSSENIPSDSGVVFSSCDEQNSEHSKTSEFSNDIYL